MKKLLAGLMTLSLAACGEETDTVDKSSSTTTASSSDSSNSNIEEQFVGRWEQSYLNNSDDESFEQYDAVTLDYEKRFIELYSNGKGVTDYFVGDYCNGNSVAFEWEVAYDDFYKKDTLYIYYAVEEDECDEFGFKVNETSPYDLSFKNAKIEGIKKERNTPAEMYETPVETVSFRFFDDYMPFVKVDGFKDNPDLGCENTFKSIELYRTDPKAYRAQFED